MTVGCIYQLVASEELVVDMENKIDILIVGASGFTG